MLALTDPRWLELKGGYRRPYDPRRAFAKLRAGEDSAWGDLWNNLHHQGSVDLASYAAVPHLVQLHRELDVPDSEMYALISTIEICRDDTRNPALPDWLKPAYDAAWHQVIELACRDLPRVTDETISRAILAAVAFVRNLRPHGRALLELDSDEITQMIEDYYH